jgi:hypothetical protein
MLRYLDHMADEPEPTPRPLALKINKWNRAIFDILGLAGLGAGGAAVFITHLEAGPVALIAAGLLLLLIGMGGRMPSRLKVGENEAAWEIEREAVEVFVERVAEDVPVESRPELLDALDDLAKVSPFAARRGVRALAYERNVRAEIEEIARELQVSTPGGQPIKFSTEVPVDQQRVDAILEGPDGRLVAVEMKWSTMGLSAAWLDVVHQMLSDKSPSYRGPRVMLMITGSSVSEAFKERLKEYPEIHHVVAEGPQDREALRQALRKVLFG